MRERVLLRNRSAILFEEERTWVRKDREQHKQAKAYTAKNAVVKAKRKD